MAAIRWAVLPSCLLVLSVGCGDNTPSEEPAEDQAPEHQSYQFNIAAAPEQPVLESEPAPETEPEPQPAPKGIEGVWYVQTSPDGFAHHWDDDGLNGWDYRPDGWVHPLGGGATTKSRYEADPEAGILIHSDPDSGFVLRRRYEIAADGVLHIWQAGAPDGVRPFEYELARTREGLPRHQARREADRQPFSPHQQQQAGAAMFDLMQTAHRYAVFNRTLPTDLGTMLIKPGKMPHMPSHPGQVIAPWAQLYLPDHFSQMSSSQQVEWINSNSSYVYLGAGRTSDEIGKAILVFELAPRHKTETIGFVTNRPRDIQRLPYDEADKRIREQTGHSMEAWLAAEFPGAGRLNDD